MRYQVTTPRTPREALEQALADFGPGGLGLQLTSQTNVSLVFQGGGGHIAVTAEPGAHDDVGHQKRVSGIMASSSLWHGSSGGAPGGSAGGSASNQARRDRRRSPSSNKS